LKELTYGSAPTIFWASFKIGASLGGRIPVFRVKFYKSLISKYMIDIAPEINL
jgi:hypothetical protein